MPITLPTSVNVPPDNIHLYTILIAGPKKIGKTSLAAAAGKNTYIIQGEPKNSIALPYRQTDVIKWPDLLEVIKLLAVNPKYCDVKVIDDVPSFYNMCLNYICNKHAFEHPSDLGYGKGWNFLWFEYEKQFKVLQALPGGIIYTAHTEMKEYEKRTGGKFNRLETSMSGQANKLMDALVQLWMVMDYNKEGERIITVRGNDFIKAGCGLQGRFLYPDGSEINEIPLGKSAEEGWSNIVKGFHNILEKPIVKPKATVSVSIPVNTAVQTKKPGLKLGK